MTVRQSLALSRPLNSAGDDVSPFRDLRKHPSGMLIMTILAVDR